MNQLHPRAVWSMFVSLIARWFVIFLLVVIYSVMMLFKAEARNSELALTFGWLGWAVLVFVILAIVLYLWARLSWKYYRYEIRPEGLHIERGVITKKYATIPFDRIQNVDIYRGLLSRMLGLSDLQFQTAGYSGDRGVEGRLPGLGVTDAEKLRDELLRLAKQSRSHGL